MWAVEIEVEIVRDHLDWIVVVAQCAAALGTLVAAGISWRSAKQSRAAAEASQQSTAEANEAIGLLQEPDVDVRWAKYSLANGAPATGLDVYAVVEHGTSFAAADVELTVRLKDGTRIYGHADRLNPGEQIDIQVYDTQPEGIEHWLDPVAKVYVTYSDERKLVRWKDFYAAEDGELHFYDKRRVT